MSQLQTSVTDDKPRASPQAVGRRLGGRSARIRRAVFDAALRLLAEGGYHALTMEAVSAAAGVNKTTVYRNWPTKAVLVRAAAEDRSEALISTETTGDPEHDLVAFLTSVAENATSPIGQALVIGALNESVDPQVIRERASFWEHRFHAAGDLIRSAMNDGSPGNPSDVDAIIEHLIGPVFLRAFVTGRPIDRSFIKRTVRAAVHLASRGATRQH
jgi:AcrR family transcriptional regulator